MLTLHEMVELVPELYEELRKRDSLANHVCEIYSRNGQVREVLHKWQKSMKNINRLVEKAVKKRDELDAIAERPIREFAQATQDQKKHIEHIKKEKE
jgi:hypothetical protein